MQEAGLPRAGRRASDRAPVAPRADRAGHRPATASSTRSTSGNASPNSRSASARKRVRVAGRQLDGASASPDPRRRLEPVDRRAARPARTRSPSPSRRSPRARRPRAAMIGAQQRVVGAAQQQRVDRRAGRPREDRFAGRVALAEQRRQRRRRRRPRRSGPVSSPGLDHRHERRRGVLVDLDRRVLVLDRLEVGVRADGRRRGDDADPPVARGQRGRRGAGPDDAQDRQVVAPPERPDARPPSRCCRRRRWP